MQRTKEQAAAQGFVETLFGRRLYLSDIHNKNANARAGAERAAINAPMQGTASDSSTRHDRRIPLVGFGRPENQIDYAGT